MLYQRKSHQQQWIIIRRNPVRILLTALATFVNQHLLAISPHYPANRLHRGMAGTTTIAGMRMVDVSTPEAVRTMVPMSTAGQWCANELFAVHALEGLILFRSWRSGDPLFWLGRLFSVSPIAKLLMCWLFVF
ncbi:MAG: hypothetical protein M9934_05100 [Thermomicrobiales bacterium]|nr:hypothetical protein [Thermomicrobiales bacterium]